MADFLSGSTAEEDIEGDEEDKQEEVAHDMLKLQTCGHHGVWHSMMLSGMPHTVTYGSLQQRG